ncbi:dicarboxylate/amino acid:cation symporter [Breznakiellaceae bacterium SP9]
MTKSSLLKHPLTILVAVAIGVFIGLYNAPISAFFGLSDFANMIAFPGQLYLYYLQMTVVPIIITAISSSLAKLMRNKSNAGLIRKLISVFLVCMFAVSLIGIVIGVVGKPGGNLNESTRKLLSKLISSSSIEGVSGALEISISTGQSSGASVASPSIGAFFSDLIPSNIFWALTSGSTMAIVFFSIIFGVAIGLLKDESASVLIDLLCAIFEAFQKLIGWSLYLLPFGLICLMAGQIAQVGPQIFVAMSKFIILYGIGTLVIFVLSTIVIWIRSGIANPFKVLSIVFEPVLLAFATRNSMATLPSAITCLDKRLGFETNAVNLTLPLGMTLGRFGNIFYFGIGVFFVVQIYGMELTLMHYAIIFLGTVFAGAATAGASGIVTLSVISIILNPLSLPVEAILVIFMAIDPIIDPFRTFLIVYVNMVATTLIAKRSGHNEPAPELLHENESESETQVRMNDELLVYIQEAKNIEPFFYRENELLKGLEINLLNEIGHRLGKRLVLKDTLTLTYEEGYTIKRKAAILAGGIVKTGAAPLGYSYSRSWAVFGKETDKKQLCFLFPAGSGYENKINDIIGALNKERFIRGSK